MLEVLESGGNLSFCFIADRRGLSYRMGKCQLGELHIDTYLVHPTLSMDSFCTA